MKAKWVLRHDPGMRMIRVARVVWTRGKVGDGKGYSAKLSLAVRRRLFEFVRSWDGWDVTLAGIRLHYQRSYGGTHV